MQRLGQIEQEVDAVGQEAVADFPPLAAGHDQAGLNAHVRQIERRPMLRPADERRAVGIRVDGRRRQELLALDLQRLQPPAQIDHRGVSLVLESVAAVRLLDMPGCCAWAVLQSVARAGDEEQNAEQGGVFHGVCSGVVLGSVAGADSRLFSLRDPIGQRCEAFLGEGKSR